jgi:hypothetical protein
MSEDRLAVLEERVAALERELAALRAGMRHAPGEPFVSTDPNDPLAGHPLLSKKPPREQWAELEAKRLKELGIDHLKPIGAKKLREMMIAEGVDPNSNEFSRGIIEARGE